MASRVLVTGAAGFFGSHIVQQLLEVGADVICLDIESGFAAGRLKHLEGEVPFLVSNIAQAPFRDIDISFDRVIHLAAIASPILCDQNSAAAFEVNVSGTLNVLRLAQRHDARVVLASTAHVYGISPKYLPSDERHPLWLQDVYTVTKILGEQLCQLFYDNYGLRYISLRVYNAYGPGQPMGYFIPDMIAKAKAGHIELKAAEVTKDFIFIKDVAQAFVKVVFTEHVGPINIGSGRETSLKEVASFIADKLGATLSELPYSEAPTRMACDWTKAFKVLGWKPTVSLTDGLTSTLEAWS